MFFINNIFSEKKIHDIMKKQSGLTVSSDATQQLHQIVHAFCFAMIESAISSAILNNRKTIMSCDIDNSIDSFYNFMKMFNDIQDKDDVL